jgi:hypothetical protein|tara:strand:+ start:139 stop:828 length:690 start_codon:yes stop_codon:yes gene_type:complete
MKRLLLLTALLIPLASFSVLADEPELYSVSNENTPAIGEILTRYLGDKMTLQRTGKYLPCYKSNVRLEDTFGLTRALQVIEKGALFCKKSTDSKYPYEAQDVNVWASGYEIKASLNLKEGRKKSKVCLLGMHCFKKVPNDVFITQFERSNFLIVEDDSLQQSIEYSGKSGSILSFTYSEYEDKMARDAFTREFKVDLNDSSVGGFKGAIFEVISADNVQIEYKMIRHFQ